MSRLDRGLKNDLSFHLNDLEESDYLDEDASTSLTALDNLLTGEIAEGEPKMTLYKNEEFKKFLREYLLKKHNIKKEKMSNKYCEKVYRSMYSKNVMPKKSVNLYEKILYHPDVTETDYRYVQNKMSNFGKYVLYNQIGCFALITFLFYKTPFGEFARANTAIGALILGGMPLGVLLGTQKLNTFLLNRRLRLIGMEKKYNITQSYPTKDRQIEGNN